MREAFLRREVIVVVGLVLALFARSTSRATDAPAVTIGFINPATGPFAALGKYARKGLDLALAEAKTDPALRNVAFRVVQRDSEAKAAQAIRYARELTGRENVDVLMGGLSSAECLSLEKFAGEEKIIYVPASGCWVDEFSSQENVNRYSFRSTLDNRQRNYSFAQWLTGHLGRRWYVVYSDYAYGQSGLKAFTEAVEAAGGGVVGSIGIPFGATDVAAYISKVDASAEALYFVLAGRDAILALQEALAQGLQKKMKFAGMQSLVSAENFPRLPQAAEGLVFIGDYPRDANGPLETPANREFRAAYFAKYPGDVIGLNAFEAYQSANALLEGIKRSGFRGRRDTEKLAAVLAGLRVPAGREFPAGPLTIRRRDHQGVAPLYVAQVRAGREIVLDLIPAAEIGGIR